MSKFVIYQVFTRLFGNEVAVNKPSGTIEENGCGKFNSFTPKALKSIKALGATHVWYTGVIEHATQTDYSAYGILPDHAAVVKGRAGSPYAIKDYYDVDPDLAEDVNNRMAELEALVKRTHKEGLKVIIDFVPNHVARQYHSDAKPAGVVDLGESDHSEWAFSPLNNFYYLPGQAFAPQFDVDGYQEYPAKATGNDQFTASPSINDWYETVKLNYGVNYVEGGQKQFDPIPDTWMKMRDILLFWASKGIDGFRCDMAEMVPVEFWGWVIPQVKAQYGHIIFIAEVYNPTEYRNYLWNGKFDYLYDKVGLYDTLRDILSHNADASRITYCWQALEGIQDRMLNFLENHDEQRIASGFFAGDGAYAVPAMIVSATLSTAPVMIYAGQELGEKGMDAEGFSGLDGRTTIFDYWGVATLQTWCNGGKFDTKKLTEEQRSLRAFYQKLLNLTLSEKALSDGLLYDLQYANINNPAYPAHKVFSFMRQYEQERLLIVVNFDDKTCDAEVVVPSEALEYLGIAQGEIFSVVDILNESGEEKILKAGENYQLTLKSWSGKILKLTKI